MTVARDALDRFVEAQDHGVFEAALAELRRGRKTSHWMWFVFPQIAGLGQSATSRRYAIASIDEARGYLAHPVLGTRYLQCLAALQALPTTSAVAVFGSIDAMKLRSSLTLFLCASSSGGATSPATDGPFAAALAKYFGGALDEATVRLLG